MGKERREQGHLERKKRKIPLEELRTFVEAHKVTLKKTTSFKEQDPEKVAEFLDILNSLKDLPVVYIDETGIDRYLYRPYVRAPYRGESLWKD